VLTAGVSARYGRFQGGVVNAITKSGGNEFTGAARAVLSKDSWNSKTPFGEAQSDTLSKVYQATVGGFVARDRLWFFAGGRTIPTSTVSNTTIGTSEAFVSETTEDRWQLKLRGALTSDHVLEGSYMNRDLERSGHAGLPAGDLLALTNRTDPQKLYTFAYQGVLTSNFFVDAIATKKEVSISSGGADNGRSPFSEEIPGTFRIYNNHWWDANDPTIRDNDTASINLTQALSTGDWGEHTLEYGLQYVKSHTAGLNNQSPTGYNLLNYDAYYGETFAECVGASCTFNMLSYYDGGFSYRWVAIPIDNVFQDLKNTAAYLQDSWSMGKWRVDAGVRWEKYTSSTTFPYLDVDFSDWSPRLGVTYNIDQHWQVQASWAKYVARFNDNVASNVSGVSGAPFVVSIYTGPSVTNQTYQQIEDLLRNDAHWGITTSVTDPNQPTSLIDPGAKSPYSNDLNFSVKRALPRNSGTFTLTYTKREYRDLLSGFRGGQGIVTVVDPFGSGVSSDFDLTVWKNSDEAKRDYDAITATFDWRPSAVWNLGGNYTISDAKGNYEGEGRNTPASGSVIGFYPNSVNKQMAYPYGFLSTDIRHRVNLFGAYRLNFDRAGNLVLGGVFRYQSASPWNRVLTQRLANDPEYIRDTGSYSAFFNGRGNDRFNGWWRLDMSARYQFPIYQRLNAYVKVDVINILNNDEVINWQTTGTPVTVPAQGTGLPNIMWAPAGNCGLDDPPSTACSSFGRITGQGNYQTPRSYLLTLGLQF
jgi:outer membrane receptor protein involved in Fe transport